MGVTVTDSCKCNSCSKHNTQWLNCIYGWHSVRELCMHASMRVNCPPFWLLIFVNTCRVHTWLIIWITVFLLFFFFLLLFFLHCFFLFCIQEQFCKLFLVNATSCVWKLTSIKGYFPFYNTVQTSITCIPCTKCRINFSYIVLLLFFTLI